MDIDAMLTATRKRGGGRIPHVEQFLGRISDDHADKVREVLTNTTITDVHASRFLTLLRDEEYPSFPLGMSEGAVRYWRSKNL